ncbi:MAG TPA: hypothetical protein VFX37_05485 [Pseudolabrys sp.]|nr:hypothetical protein [Pseudolabrys sp.]
MALRDGRRRSAIENERLPGFLLAGGQPVFCPTLTDRLSLPLSSMFGWQFDRTTHRNTLFSTHRSPTTVRLSAVAGAELIAAFARFSGVRVIVSATIHAVCRRLGGRLTLRLRGIRDDWNYTYRKASNHAHDNDLARATKLLGS